MANDIPAVQNQEGNLTLRRAAFEAYAGAQVFLNWQLALTVALPVVISILGLLLPSFRPAAGIISIIVLGLDILWLDRSQKQKIMLAAKAAEKFDTIVLDIPWNEMMVGREAELSAIAKLDLDFRQKSRKANLPDWYPIDVVAAPMHLARIICQLTNAQYDGRLRPVYKLLVAAIALGVFVALIWAGLALGLPLADFIAAVLLPALPLMTWAVREFHRQSDTARSVGEIEEKSLRLWAGARGGLLSEAECRVESRSLQDLIYLHRSKSPLPIPFVYNALRDRLEDRMNVSAKDRLREIGL
ncbi:S-4TM family putative pore-forming effector [Devosia sp. A369]